MKSRNTLRILLATTFLAAAARLAPAEPPAPNVSADGSSTIEKPPEFLRMVTELQVDGPNIKDALAKLKSRREEIKASLIKLGAVESSIDLGQAAVVSANSGNPQDQVTRLVRQRMTSPKAAASQPAGKPVTLTTEIRADWALKPAGLDDMLVEATELQNKIKAAKVAAIADPLKAARAQEAEEEGSSDFNGEQQSPKPGEPSFVYVAKISQTERAQARTDAFAKAKAAADRLAKAAGVSLGELFTLGGAGNGNSSFEGGGNNSLFTDGGDQSYAQRIAMSANPKPDAAGAIEAVSPTWGKIFYQASVSATFLIK